jgi:3,4-dihydroxy 2-butanone 4-phosphate synthase/GTP cyclohydrolase II
MDQEIKFNTIEEALEEIRSGRMVIVVDDEDRENEGDFVMAAQFVTPEAINFMLKHGRGLLCVPLLPTRCKELGLVPMVQENTAPHGTAFTVTVDYIGDRINTGISVRDRARTIQALIDPGSKPEDFAKPGHIMPLQAVEDGVLRRAGHTEAAVDLARLAGLYPAGVIIEILNDEGETAKLPELIQIAQRFQMKIISIADLIKYRLRHEQLVEPVVRVKMPTKYGEFDLIAYRHKYTGEIHLALVKGQWEPDEPVLVRVHSSCFTGDIIGSLRCDCGDQLHLALLRIEQEGKGVFLYMNQEGRGIGLLEKLKAYKLQEDGYDTYEANLMLGYRMDEREYGIGAQILRHLGVHKMRLMTNNPKKRAGLDGYDLQIVEIVPIVATPNPYNYFYLKTKKEKGNHQLPIE